MVSDRLLRVNHTDALRALMASRTIPGLALAVIANGQIVQHYVLGITQQTATPLTESSLFQAASLSKPLFAYGVLRLWQQGVLDLDIPLTVLAPGVYTDSNIADITARQVLSHTTGFPNWWETPDTGSRLPLATPGTRFGYSGEGYEYLQRAIERMIGQPLHVFLHQTVLAPLRMQVSRFGWGVDAAGIALLDADGIAMPHGDRMIASAAWSLLTTATDYARLLIAILHPAAHIQHNLNAASIAAMLTPLVLVGQHTSLMWSMGWGLQQTAAGLSFWHWGGPQNGYASYAVGFPDQQIGVVVLTNGEEGHSVCEAIAQLVLDMPEVAHPAFRWILPTEEWRPDGSR